MEVFDGWLLLGQVVRCLRDDGRWWQGTIIKVRQADPPRIHDRDYLLVGFRTFANIGEVQTMRVSFRDNFERRFLPHPLAEPKGWEAAIEADIRRHHGLFDAAGNRLFDAAGNRFSTDGDFLYIDEVLPASTSSINNLTTFRPARDISRTRDDD